MATLADKTALVTGASSGIGLEIAQQLAARGADLIITARREDRLEALAERLRAEHQVAVDVIAADLGQIGGAQELFSAVSERGPIDILVNNAGFGGYQSLVEIETERVLEMLDLNVRALTELTCRFLPQMLERERAYILNVGSVVAWVPIPKFAAYCGTKAYVRHFSESLAAELSSTNVTVTCLSPGATATEFIDVSGQKKPAQGLLMSPERCARIGVKAMLRGKRQVVAGGSNKLICFFSWLMPRRAMGAISARVIGEPEGPDAVKDAA